MFIFWNSKSKFFKLLFCLSLIPILYACRPVTTIDDLQNETGDLEKILNENRDHKESTTSFKVKEKKSSPDKRLSVVWYFVDDSRQAYRLTVIDKEQKKVMFSREFELKSSSQKENIKLVSIVKVLNQIVLLKEESSKHKQYYALKPDTGEIWTLKCPDFRVGEYDISYFAQDGYQCEGLLKTSREFNTSKTKPFPKFIQPSNKKSSLTETQIVEKDSLKVELSPYKSSKMQTILGERSSLKYFKDGKLIYTKFFSGKCTGCQWINQENWNESFRIEQVLDNRILLTQILVEVDDNGKVLPTEPLHTSILLVPSKDKILHLNCNEKDNEIAYVAEITSSSYKCKYSTDTKTYFKTKKLPK